MSPFVLGANRANESAQQKALFCWLNMASWCGFEVAWLPEAYTKGATQQIRPKFRLYPDLELVYAIPNGGKRDKITAARLRAEGQKAGIPDIHFPVARAGFNSLYVEMKTTTGRLSESQEAVIPRLLAARNHVALCRNWTQAAMVIENYFNGKIITF